MKSSPLLLPLFAAFLFLACQPKPVNNPGMSLADSLITGLSSAISSGNLDQTLGFMADDILVLDMGSVFAGIDTLRTHMAPLMPYYKDYP